MKGGFKCNVTLVPELRMTVYKKRNEYFEIKQYV